MNKRLPLATALAAASIAAAIAGPPAALGAGATHVVKLQNIAIHPSRLVIHAGDRVTWQFLDAKIMAPHTVTSTAGGQRFKSTGAHLSGSYSVTFAKQGTYRYVCTIHPGMLGSIVVR